MPRRNRRDLPEEITIKKLVVNAAKSEHSILSLFEQPNCEEGVKIFEDVVFRSAKIIYSGKPQEISKMQVDVNEKIYTNEAGSEDDESIVKIVKSSETSQGYNYEQQTTKGFEWGAGANIGAQFGLPQVGIGLTANTETSFKKKNLMTVTQSFKQESRFRQDSSHEETLTIPPGYKVTVVLTSYRVKYRMDYTMQYSIPRSSTIRVKWGLLYCCGLFIPAMSGVSAASVLRSMPDYEQDDENITFTQEGSLSWFADRMEVEKIANKL